MKEKANVWGGAGFGLGDQRSLSKELTFMLIPEA